MDAVKVADPLIDYVQRLVAHTRTRSEFAYGLSPRGTLALLQAARAWALRPTSWPSPRWAAARP